MVGFELCGAKTKPESNYLIGQELRWSVITRRTAFFINQLIDINGAVSDSNNAARINVLLYGLMLLSPLQSPGFECFGVLIFAESLTETILILTPDHLLSPFLRLRAATTKPTNFLLSLASPAITTS